MRSRLERVHHVASEMQIQSMLQLGICIFRGIAICIQQMSYAPEASGHSCFDLCRRIVIHGSSESSNYPKQATMSMT